MRVKESGLKNQITKEGTQKNIQNWAKQIEEVKKRGKEEGKSRVGRTSHRKTSGPGGISLDAVGEINFIW